MALHISSDMRRYTTRCRDGASLRGVEARLMAHYTTTAGAAGLALFGTGALIAPKMFAGQFGLPTEDPVALAFVRATGARDLVLGALIFASQDDPRSLGRILAFSSLLGLADAFALASVRGLRPQHLVHLGGFVALLLAASRADE
jgi:hypothetical protein